jgi:hypothetical protein
MRALAILCLLAGVARAGHSTVVVMSDPELGSALQVALQGRGIAIATVPRPGGALRLERAAAAQRAAIDFGADAAVWIDLDVGSVEVCAVSSDGRYFRHAPLPDESPRVVAAIATSLLDELLAPPEANAPHVAVDVHVDVGGAPAPLAGPPAVIAGPPQVVAAAAPLPARGLHEREALLGFGVQVSPVTAAAELSLSFPVNEAYRFAFVGGLGELVWDSDHDLVYMGAAEVRHVGLGVRHLDLGVQAGVAYADEGSSGTLAFLGLPLRYAFDSPSGELTVAFVPVIASDGRDTVPGAYATLGWELPL